MGGGLNRRWRLEVLRDDVAGLEGGDEALDLLLHVGLHQALEIADQGLRAAVELLVEALDDVLLEHARAAPLAVGAAQRDLPVGVAGLVPVDGVDQLGVARLADVEIRDRLRRRAGGGRGAEVDDLDGLAGGQDHATDVGAVVGLAVHGVSLSLATSSAGGDDLFNAPSERKVGPGALTLIWGPVQARPGTLCACRASDLSSWRSSSSSSSW